MIRRFRTTTYLQSSYWLAAIAVGVAAVLYAKLIGAIQGIYFESFVKHPYLQSIATPFLFLFSSALVVKLAPQAKGSGIPQILQAIELSQKSEPREYADLVSIKTALSSAPSSASPYSENWLN